MDTVLECGGNLSDDEHAEYMFKHYEACEDAKFSADVAMVWCLASKNKTVVQCCGVQ